MADYKTIEVVQDGEVDWVTLNRPDALNALDKEMTQELYDYFTQLYHDHSRRIVVLKANGRAFCAGIDLAEAETETGAASNVQDVMNRQVAIADIMKAIARCAQPVIALLNGPVCGGGFTLALAADIRIAADDCKMNAAFIKIGLTGCDMGSSYFLPRLVGASVAAEFILTGRFIYADRALSTGLVSEVVAKDALVAAAQSYIDDMLLTAPMGLRLTKQSLRLAIDAPSLDAAMAMEDRHQVLLAHTKDHKEAVSAFFEKRSPHYSDE